MPKPLTIIGAPSSAGAYGPGQEKTPQALRSAGLIEYLTTSGITVEDLGDVQGFRWRADRKNLRAMNADAVARVAGTLAKRMAPAVTKEHPLLILGGDCTIELGTVAGVLKSTENIGLVYIDLDTDLNTPESTNDGALDWMGVAHMLGIKGTVPALTKLGTRLPMLNPDQLLFFAHDNVKPFEQNIIDDYHISEVRLQEVVANPSKAAHYVVKKWAAPFDRLLIHLDVDVLDYIDMPLAENYYRRHRGLRFNQLMEALRILLQAPNWAALTITEINPDHGESDGSTLRTFARALSKVLALSPRLHTTKDATL